MPYYGDALVGGVRDGVFFSHPFREEPRVMSPRRLLDNIETGGVDALPPEPKSDPPPSEKDRKTRLSRVARLATIGVKGVGDEDTYARATRDGKGECFSLQFVEDGDDKELVMTYARFPAVLKDMISADSLRWLRRRLEKEERKGRGQHEFIALALSGYIALTKGILVEDLDWADLLVDRTFGPVPPTLHKGYRGYINDGNVRGALQFLAHFFVLHKALILSDTPSWISVSEDLLLLLAHTDVRGVTRGDIQLPLPAVFLDVPVGFFRDSDGLEARAIGVAKQVAELEDGTPWEFLSVVVYLHPEKGEGFVPVHSGIPMEHDSDILSNISMPYEDEEKAEEATILGEVVSREEAWLTLLKIVLNVILYVNSPSADLKEETVSQTKKVKVRGRRSKVQLNRFQKIIAGTSVRLSNDVRNALRSGTGANSKITYSFVVRGHWRNQAYGPKRSLRKRKWIEPFVKGRDLATRIVGHTYEERGEVS